VSGPDYRVTVADDMAHAIADERHSLVLAYDTRDGVRPQRGARRWIARSSSRVTFTISNTPCRPRI
jgi:hypothetical protein